MANRAKGVWVEDTGLSQAGKDAKKAWKQEKDRLRTERAERRERPVPNRVCYAAAFANWRSGMPLPKCNRCGATLFPEENHKCEGFKPKYIDHDDEWHERADARRAEQREAIHNHMMEMRQERYEQSDAEYQDEFESRTIECDDCGEELYGMEDAMSHDCPARDR